MFENILKLGLNEIILINGLEKAAREAKEAAKIIRETYTFMAGKEKTEVYHDKASNNVEFYTRDGVWEVRYLDQEYDVPCTEEELFKYFRAEYMVDEKFIDTPEMREMKLVCSYLRSFISRTKKIYLSKTE